MKGCIKGFELSSLDNSCEISCYLDKDIDKFELGLYQNVEIIPAAEYDALKSKGDSLEAVCTELIKITEESLSKKSFDTDMIKGIYWSDKPGKEKTIVIFNDGTKIIKEVKNGDTFDLNVGVALCVAEYLFGGNTRFHKMIKSIATRDGKALPAMGKNAAKKQNKPKAEKTIINE